MKKFVALTLVCSLFLYACFNKEKVENKLNTAKVELGRALFFDKRLSEDNSTSCASCHQPQHGFSDNKKGSVGVFEQITTRNSPPLNNLLKQTSFFHDGRAKSLVQQAMEVMNNPKEMGNAHLIPSKLTNDSNYVNHFKSIYQSEINLFLVADALTEFEKSIQSTNNAYDLFLKGDASALTLDQQNGLSLFKSKARCATCHTGANLTDNQFYNIGFYNKSDSLSDKGRFLVTNDSSDLGRFRTPSLRNIALSAPYFHNGSVANLRDVINRYNKPNPMGDGDFKDRKLRPIHLTELEKYQLQQFLIALTDYQQIGKFVERSVIDSIQQTQIYSKNDYQQFDLIRGFDQKFNYIRLFQPKISQEINLKQLSTFKTNEDIQNFKIKAEQVLRTKHKSIFESGEYLLFNQEIEYENNLIHKLNLEKLPTIESIDFLKKRIQFLNRLEQTNPTIFNWEQAIFDYRSLPIN